MRWLALRSGKRARDVAWNKQHLDYKLGKTVTLRSGMDASQPFKAIRGTRLASITNWKRLKSFDSRILRPFPGCRPGTRPLGRMFI